MMRFKNRVGVTNDVPVLAQRSGQITPSCTDVSSAPFTADTAKKLGQGASIMAFTMFIFSVLVQAAGTLYEARGYQVQAGLNTNMGPAFLVGHVQFITILRNMGGLSAAPTSLHAFVEPFSWGLLDTGGLDIIMFDGWTSAADMCQQSWGNPLLERLVVFVALLLLVVVARLLTLLVLSSDKVPDCHFAIVLAVWHSWIVHHPEACT